MGQYKFPKWIEVKIERAKAVEDRYYIREIFQEAQDKMIVDKGRMTPNPRCDLCGGSRNNKDGCIECGGPLLAGSG